MKKIILAFVLALAASNIFAFLPEPSVKGAALGGAYAAGNGDDVFASSFNPASPLNPLGMIGGAWHKTERVGPVYSLGFAHNLPHGFKVQVFGDYQRLSEQKADNAELRAGFGLDFLKMGTVLPISLGVNFKQGWFSQDKTAHDDGFAADAGLVLTPVKNLSLGFVYNNIGGQDLYAHNTYSIGGAYVYTVNPDNILEFRLDAGRTDNWGRVGLGAEYLIYNLVALRLGHVNDAATSNYTYGLGLNFKEWGRFDAAYLPYHYNNKTYKLSYMIPFGFTSEGAVAGKEAQKNVYDEGERARSKTEYKNQTHNVLKGGAAPERAQPEASGPRESVLKQETAAEAVTEQNEVYIYPGMEYDDGSVEALKAINAKSAAGAAVKGTVKTSSSKPKRTM